MRKHAPFIVLFFLFLLTGILHHGDYGMSWDESECRIDNGILNTNFISTHDEVPLLKSISKYHGAAFEMLLVVIEKEFALKSLHDIFLMRHLVTFLLFALSVAFFYLLCLKAFGSRWNALAGCAMLVLSPRIFADAFYNSKDLPFLSLVIISVYFIVLFLNNPSIRNAIFCGIVNGALIDIRIMGVLLPLFAFGYSVILLFRLPSKRKIIISAIAYALVLVSTIILLWPVLWLGPVKHFFLAWSEMSKYPWDGAILFNGKIFRSAELPWYYVPLWMLVSIPILYSAFFVIGIFIIAKKFILKREASLPELFSLYLFFVPIASVVLLKSIIYDGWRHLFFIYPAFVIIAVVGMNAIIGLLNDRFRLYFVAGVSAYFASIIFTMVELHPFENVYFNSFAGEKARDNYEVDYWGLSFKQAFEYILKNDTSTDITVEIPEEQPGVDNLLFLPQKYRERFTVTKVRELGDYFITILRHERRLFSGPNIHYIERNGLVINSISDLRNSKLYFKKEDRIAFFENKYEHDVAEFHPDSIGNDPDGNHYEIIKPKDDFSVNFNIAPTVIIPAGTSGTTYMKLSMKLRSQNLIRATLVVQADSTNTFIWETSLIKNADAGVWNKIYYTYKLPESISAAKILKVHVMNDEHFSFQIDDFAIEFLRVRE